MTDRLEAALTPFFRRVLALRWWIIALYGVLLGVSIPFAMRVEQDNGIDRLIVKGDPDFVATQEFNRAFGGGEYVVLFAEADDPFRPDVLAAVDGLDRTLRGIPKVESNSLLSIYRRARPDADPLRDPEEFKRFATGTDLFRRQGLVGPTFYGLPLILDVHDTAEREAVLEAIDAAVADRLLHPAPLSALRRVGEPYVNSHLNRETNEAGMRLFPVFFGFVILLVLGLYRSIRALVAIVVTMLVNVALAVGYIGMTGGTFTIVSALIPMTILITCLANLVYIHSRFVEHHDDTDLATHHVFALSNKFLACTASVLATAIGFAALYVSDIRPIRELGTWVAVGLVITWAVSFTLFPALQSVLRTPTQAQRKTAAQWFRHAVENMPLQSYRWRWVTVGGALALCAAGGVALFGLPGRLPPMKMMTDPIDYINADSELYQDTRRVEQLMPGLSMAELWLKGRVGTLNQPEVVRGLEAFQAGLEAEPMIGSAVGPTNVLRSMRYLAGKGDLLPRDPDELTALTDNLETALKEEPLLSRFVDPKDLSQTHVTLVTRINDYPTWEALGDKLTLLWRDTVARHPALLEFDPEGDKRFGTAWSKVAAAFPVLTGVDGKDAERAVRAVLFRHPHVADLPPADSPVWAEARETALEEAPGLGPVLAERSPAFWKVVGESLKAVSADLAGPRMVGLGRLQSKVAHNLVPTLTESFALTVGIIFSVFLLIFRNGAARLMAMIPSLFAILVMFGVMRLTGMSLNVATILIASTVLGTSENDQIHFFYHFLERNQESTEAGLRHTMFIAGRSILFATLINAVGFLAFALSDLPPIRQFGILSALAFSLSMFADFTALPGALWMVFRDRPGGLKARPPAA